MQFGILARLLSSCPRSRQTQKHNVLRSKKWRGLQALVGLFHPNSEACELWRNFVENHHVFKSQHLWPTGDDAGFVRRMHIMHIGVAPSSLFSDCWNVLENCSNLLEPETVHLEIHANTVTCSLGEVGGLKPQRPGKAWHWASLGFLLSEGDTTPALRNQRGQCLDNPFPEKTEALLVSIKLLGRAKMWEAGFHGHL